MSAHRAQGILGSADHVHPDGAGPGLVLVLLGDAQVEAAALCQRQLLLAAAGAAMENVIKTTVFLSDMNNFAAMNGVYATFFEGACPARSAVEVARLPKDALVEIECIAVL